MCLTEFLGRRLSLKRKLKTLMSTKKTKHCSINNMKPSSFKESICYLSDLPDEFSKSQREVSLLGNHDAVTTPLTHKECNTSNNSEPQDQLHKSGPNEMTGLREELMLLIDELEEILLDE